MPTALSLQLQRRIASLPPDGATAWLFPGQGAQEVGMGHDLFQTSAAAREVFQQADMVTGLPLSRLCFQGPPEDLHQTANAQPALLAASLACLAAALEAGSVACRPAFVAGHSLGEYAALVAAGALDYEDALALVRERGRLMHEAGQRQPGAMAAIMGLPGEAVEELCRQSGAEVANLNSPRQSVIAGPPQAVQRAAEAARQRGARAFPLKVSGAFHTSLMRSAGEEFATLVDAVSIRAPQISVIANASGEALSGAEAVREELKRQLVSPVRWQQSMERMVAGGTSRFIEFGPGRVLSGLVKRIDSSAQALSVDGLPALRDLDHDRPDG